MSGEPVSYLTLRQGTSVVSSDGEQVGEVAHVLAAEEQDIFDGIVIDASWLPGGHVFADAAQIAEMRSDAVTLALDGEGSRGLPQPSENPAAMEAGPDDVVDEGVGDDLRDKLRRAWDLVSGNY
ncbi:MAG: hypothetical protein AABM29_11090 [Actinomycetota bacterium]